MRIFPEAEERKLHELELARGWARSGLIRPDQLQSIEAGLGPVLARAGWAVRLLLMGLCACAQAALYAFLTWGIRGDDGLRGWYLLGTAALSYTLGELVIPYFRLYRFGVEEALMVGAVLQASVGLYLVMPDKLGLFAGDRAFLAWCVTAALCAWLYRRCGYLGAALAAVLALSGCVVSLDIQERGLRVALAALYAALLAASTLAQDPEHERDDRRFVRAVLFLGFYLVFNLRLGEILSAPGLGGPHIHHRALPLDSFYWATFALIWAIPAAGLALAVRLRHRPLLAAAVVTALLTLMTYKPYLGWARHSWDAAVLGTALMALAAWLTRWLDSGPDRRRDGFTARPAILPRDEGVDAAALLAVAAAAQTPAPEPRELKGGGGDFGGGGASGDF